MASPGVGGSLSAASDVYFNNPVQDNTLKYDNSLHMWTNDENTTTIGGVSGLQAALDSKAPVATTAITVTWNGTAWPTYSTDPARIRHFYSQDDENATAPTGYNLHDVWFAHPEGN